MNEFTTVYLFTDLGDSQNRLAIWSVIVFVMPMVWFLFYLLWNTHIPKQPDWRKGKVYIGNRSLPMRNFLRALITIVLVWFTVTAMLFLLTTDPEGCGKYGLVTLRSPRYAKLQKLYISHQYFVAEGNVDVLHAQRREGHEGGDIVRIGDAEFEFSFYSCAYGYHQTISHGGALTEGTYARVFYVESEYWPDYTYDGRYTILRVDVKK